MSKEHMDRMEKLRKTVILECADSIVCMLLPFVMFIENTEKQYDLKMPCVFGCNPGNASITYYPDQMEDMTDSRICDQIEDYVRYIFNYRRTHNHDRQS